MGLIKIWNEDVAWIQLILDNVWEQVLMYMVKSLQIPYKVENFMNR
jgi:hypothetical protein